MLILKAKARTFVTMWSLANKIFKLQFHIPVGGVKEQRQNAQQILQPLRFSSLGFSL